MIHRFFLTPKDFRLWLENNSIKEHELLVGFYKIGTGKTSMTWPESVDQALCFGWIDGIRKSIDSESYSIRFTPRKPTSIWSAVNIQKVVELTKQGLMKPAGLEAFQKRKEGKSKIYSFENEAKELEASLQKKFQSYKIAWEFFQKQPPYYRKIITHWLMSAKQEKTKLLRLEEVVKMSERGERLNWYTKTTQ